MLSKCQTFGDDDSGRGFAESPWVGPRGGSARSSSSTGFLPDATPWNGTHHGTFETISAGLAALLTAIVTAGVAVAQQATTVGTLDGHTDPVYAIAWSPDGKTLATAGFDNTVRLWDAATRKEIKKYEGHTKLVLAVAVAPDGKHILSGSQDNTAKIWDYPTSGPVKTFAGHPAASQALAVKPDGKQFAAAAGKSVKVWDLTTGAAVKDLEGHAGEVGERLWRGDGGQLATGDKAHTIRLWKGDLTPDAVIEIPADGVLGLAYFPDNRLLVSAGSDGLARLWQLPVAAPRRFETKGPVAAFALSRDGTKLATAGADKVVRVWNPSDGKLIREVTTEQPIVAVVISHDGSHIGAWHLPTSPCGSLTSRTAKSSRNMKGCPRKSPRLPFEATGHRLAVAGEDNTIRVIIAADAKTINELKGHTGHIHALAFSPKDGDLLVSASADKTAKVWDVKQGKAVRDFEGHGDAVLSLNVSRDGSKLVTGSADKTGPDLERGRRSIARDADRTHGQGPITSAGFADDASRVATGSADESVRIWDIATGRELQRMSNHHAALAGVAFLADKKSVVSVGYGAIAAGALANELLYIAAGESDRLPQLDARQHRTIETSRVS